MREEEGRRRAGRLEIVGAWLRIWTPPRDLEVPPVPWAAVALGVVALATGAVVVALVIAPEIDEGKRERSAREERRLDAALTARAARVRHEQRARFGRLERRERATAAPAFRGAVLDRVARAVTRDARARNARGELPRRATSTRCVPFPPGSGAGSGPRAAFDCLARTATIPRGTTDRRAGVVGYPYRAIVDFGAGTWAFCKINPVAGERIVPDPRQVVPLPGACRL